MIRQSPASYPRPRVGLAPGTPGNYGGRAFWKAIRSKWGPASM